LVGLRIDRQDGQGAGSQHCKLLGYSLS
jgi:hypothetical protein